MQSSSFNTSSILWSSVVAEIRKY